MTVAKYWKNLKSKQKLKKIKMREIFFKYEIKYLENYFSCFFRE